MTREEVNKVESRGTRDVAVAYFFGQRHQTNLQQTAADMGAYGSTTTQDEPYVLLTIPRLDKHLVDSKIYIYTHLSPRLSLL